MSSKANLGRSYGKMEMSLTPAQHEAMRQLAWSPDTWWHDIPAGPRAVLYKNGWLKEVQKAACGIPGCKHPGYVTLSAKGLKVLEHEDAVHFELTRPEVLAAVRRRQKQK